MLSILDITNKNSTVRRYDRSIKSMVVRILEKEGFDRTRN